jgi:hypothetical protein
MRDVLGIDIGYGDTKTYKSIPGKKKFPTLIASPVGDNSFGDHRQRIFVNGETFLVGHDANSELGWCMDTRTSSFVGSNAWLAAIGKALVINNLFPGDMDGLRLVLGLPPGLFTTDAVGRLTDIIKSARIDASMDTDVLSYHFSKTDVKMIPQGAGIYFAYLIGIPDARNEAQKTVAVVDVGHYTIDTVLFVKGQYVNSATGSATLGVSILLDRIRTEFSKENGKFINNDTALKLFMERKVSIFQQDYTVKAMDQLMSLYALQISSHIDSFFEGLGQGKVDLGVAAGGGITLVQNHLHVKNRILVLANPDMANVIGYWHYGLNTK